MDPLSIIASSVAIAGSVSITLKALHRTFRAKPELLSLLNEITDLTTILRQVEGSLQLGEQADNHLVEIISETKAKLQQLSDAASSWITPSSRLRSVDGPQLRWLRVALKVKTFQDEFRALRSKLKLILPALTIQRSSRIELDLKQIMLFTRDTAANQDILHGHFQNELIEQRSYLQTITEKIDAQRSYLNSTALSNSAESIIIPSQSVSELPDCQTQNSNNNDEAAVKAFHHNGSIFFESSQMTAISAVGIRTAQFPRSACQPWCSCVCHIERRLRSPQLLERVIGSLFIGYSGLPGLTRKCNQHSCHLRSQPIAYVTYFFPQWFLARTISLLLSTTPLAGPVASLKVSRTVPGESAIFTYAKSGDVMKIRSLFESGLASPHDVHSESGITALHLAISHRQYSVCKFLLQANADPFMEDRTSWSAADNAWTKLLSNSLDPESEISLRNMFSETDCLERREFTILHKIVLGFVSLDLEMELAASTAQINTPDSANRTPLSLAAERGDLRSVSTLLHYGADPNLASDSHGSPLHCAAMAKDPACMTLLLEKQANPNSMTNWNQTPLHYAAAYTKDARHAEILVAGGANPHALDLDQIDPLGWAAITGNAPVAAALLNQNVNVFNKDKSGNSPLIQSLRGHHHDVLALLIQHGAHTELHSPDTNEKAWHVIATVADVLSMQMLEEALLLADCSLQITQTKVNDLQDLLKSRSDSSDELVAAFHTLIRGRDSSQSIVLSDDDVDDVWEDAMEVIQAM